MVMREEVHIWVHVGALDPQDLGPVPWAIWLLHTGLQCLLDCCHAGKSSLLWRFVCSPGWTGSSHAYAVVDLLSWLEVYARTTLVLPLEDDRFLVTIRLLNLTTVSPLQSRKV